MPLNLLAAVPPAAAGQLLAMVVTVATVAVAFLAVERLTRPRRPDRGASHEG
jgi:hypothetical protein